MVSEGRARSWQRKDFSNSNGSSRTTIGIRFRSSRLEAKVEAKVRTRARARAKGEKAQTLRARAPRVKVFRGVGNSI